MTHPTNPRGSATPAPSSRARSLSVLAFPILALALAAFPARAQLAVYTDSLQSGFTDWSWGTWNLAQTTVVHSGATAIAFEPDAWAGLFFHRDAGFTGTDYEAIELWVRGSAAGLQVTVAILSGGSPAGSAMPLAGFVEGGTVPAGSWAKATVPFSALGLSTGSWDGLWLQDSTGGNQATLYVDDIRLLARTTPPPPPPVGAAVTVSVDPTLDRRPVSPGIFGVNFGSAAQAAALKWPVRRWGGNSVTRYNWQNDTSNKGMDWFFMNVPESNPAPEDLPFGSAADRFLSETRAAGGEPILTVPLIGWTPKSRAKSWGFSVQLYGAQTETECTASNWAFWCQPDAGSGVLPGGANVTGNNPFDTSIAIGPSFVTAWMDHLAAQFGTAGSGGVRYYALDNEPALWDSTHRDVHPQPLTFDELWTKSRDVAAAIKAKDPAAVVFGPVSWGWCEYFYSAADNCSPNGADFIAHGSVPLTQWYLRQVRQYQEAHGVRLVDVLDVHYYPQASGVSLSGDESAATSARRLRSLDGLWDPTYVDESWIGTQVRLIPRMKEWIAAELPGTKLAITEYQWGNDDGLSSALAQAEALGIFAREGVDIATRWVAPAEGSLVEDAFRLWIDYDGAGARVSGSSVRASSNTPDAVSGYAVEAPGGALRVVLVNRDTVQRPVTVALAGGGARTVRLFGFDGATRLGALGTTAFSGGSLTLDLPPRSARLVEVAPGAAPASRFHPLTPCRLLDTRNAAGPFGAPAIAAGATRSFTVTQGACGVPADATALAITVTVAVPATAGALTLFPGSGAAPVTTTISFAAGKTRANNAVMSLTDGVLSIAGKQSSGSVHVIVDVSGYFR
jgi:hypothetical protein